MGQIRLLSSSLISRIAAGECIERPASVVKELVENALDAGAGRIDVSILDGGRGLIQVADDGSGMDADDLTLSVTQHATSKICDDDDLFRIHTMGFRGEALASIAAVARMRVVSRRREADVGHELLVDAGQVRGPKPCAAPPGTQIEVRDLFYPVPARRKFLRTNQTEMGHITEQVARIALAQAGVALVLKHHERVVHRLEATRDRRQRIADFYGEELASALLPIHRAGGGLVVEGLVSPPAASRRSTKWEYVFVNGRCVRDRFVTHAVREAYRSLIAPDESPVVFLFLTIDPARVDVNVHPTKSEVRWQDSNYVHGQVLAALREKFLSTNLDRPLRTSTEDGAYRERVRAAMVDFFMRTPAAAEERGASFGSRVSGDGSGAVGGSMVEPADRAAAAAAPESRVPAPESTCPVRPLRALQLHNTYLVVETEDGMMLIDQHALHERILYEELHRRVAERKLEAQRLLLPPVVRVPADRLEALESHADTLARLGIELSVAGPQSVALQAFPTLLLERVDAERFVRDLLDLLAEQGARPNLDTLVHGILDMMACKAAVKAGDPLTGEEIAALLERRERAERSSHCPHGRPSTLRLSLRDLERQFHRR